MVSRSQAVSEDGGQKGAGKTSQVWPLQSARPCVLFKSLRGGNIKPRASSLIVRFWVLHAKNVAGKWTNIMVMDKAGPTGQRGCSVMENWQVQSRRQPERPGPRPSSPTERIWSGFRLWTIPFRPLSSNVFAPWHLERKKKKKKGPSEPFCSWSSVFRSDNLITRGTFLYGRQLNQGVIRSHRKKHCRRVNRKLSKVRGTGIRLRRRHLVPCQIRDAAKSLIWQDDTTV